MPATPAIGASIGSYKVVRQLGNGLMGPVLLATHNNAYWAVRVIDEAIVRSTASLSRLVGDVLHPALVRYKEVGADPASGGFVSTDFIDAKPIARDALSGLRAAAKLELLLQTLEGLAVLHQRGAVHGCLKPSNVLLRRKGSEVQAIIIDAGFAYVPSAINAERLLRYAYPWMAPELVDAYQSGQRGAVDKALTPSVDIYAAGLLVAHVLSGRLLHTQVRSLDELRQRVRSGSLRLTGINDPHQHLDLRQLDAAIRQAADPDPAQRPSSLRAFIEALRGALPKPAAAPSAA
ncbi:MAG: protein kinase [Planctomycetota bacterium]|nr:protein kinase [Planctomycetota bacterium]MCX8039645.1 protein kinase [Planctomycetota bacterium]MDW8373520.1 protein kinase [Planctomycetota bacterium]